MCSVLCCNVVLFCVVDPGCRFCILWVWHSVMFCDGVCCVVGVCWLHFGQCCRQCLLSCVACVLVSVCGCVGSCE